MTSSVDEPRRSTLLCRLFWDAQETSGCGRLVYAIVCGGFESVFLNGIHTLSPEPVINVIRQYGQVVLYKVAGVKVRWSPTDKHTQSLLPLQTPF